jgi:hypothetical protein
MTPAAECLNEPDALRSRMTASAERLNEPDAVRVKDLVGGCPGIRLFSERRSDPYRNVKPSQLYFTV